MEELYTFKDLIEKFNLEFTDYNMPVGAKIKWLAARGIWVNKIKRDNNTGKAWLFAILNDVNNTYTQKQIMEKYGWTSTCAIPDFVAFAENRGVVLELYDFCKKPYYYKIIDDKIATYQWFPQPQYPELEVCKEGYIRNKEKKNIYKSNNGQGYIQFRDYKNNKSLMAHRLILETFNPAPDEKYKYVDHINGIRSDNRLENLRWVTEQTNMIYRQENWTLLQNNFNELLQLVGYETLNQILKEQLDKYKK